jgi:predicted nucleic-acid-binding protein
MSFERQADIQQARQYYQSGFDFADALLHASTVGCTALATFDQRFKKLAAKASLKPPVIVPSEIQS